MAAGFVVYIIWFTCGENRDPEEGSNELYGHAKIRETGIQDLQEESSNDTYNEKRSITESTNQHDSPFTLEQSVTRLTLPGETRSTVYSGEKETRIVLIGKIGAGKSSTANSLFGCNCFEATDDPTLVTKKCVMVKGTVRRKPVLLIDTPGIFGINENEKETELEIKRCIHLAAPGPHAFLFIMEYGRIRKDDIESIKTFFKYFGENLKHFIIIIFTHAEIMNEYQTIDQWLRKLPDLDNFLNECERRYCLISNKANARDTEQYVISIMHAIEALKFKNGLLCYTDEYIIDIKRKYLEKDQILGKISD
ncbi:GTPase IMAP family member 9-like isoform X2 [Mytilus galloprovincialis]|uniref:GTPase IMAP family member 9-like isoform X2 n=1 Tax=Mytilus galloprovincialis TaxID=29158 RepID=UPI003F7B5BCA